MSKYEKGILGAFSGKVGTVVGVNWRGIDIMRSRPRKSTKPPTLKQETQRLRFAVVAHFLRYIRPVINAYYGAPQGKKSRRNLATSYHMTEAVTGDYPDFAIDYTKVVLAMGPMIGLQDPVAVPQPDAAITFTWEDNSGTSPQALEKATDGLLVVVYHPALNRYETREMAAQRSVMTYTIALPANWAGETVHCWLSFVAADGRMNASSVYMGGIVLA